MAPRYWPPPEERAREAKRLALIRPWARAIAAGLLLALVVLIMWTVARLGQ